MVAVIATGHGYKVRCLTCGHTGPESESKNLAWTALLRSPKEAGEVGSLDAPASYGTAGKGNRVRRR